MGTKKNPGVYDCYANAHPDEPIFVLLARDRHGPELVRRWAELREREDENSAKVAEARACADAMEVWKAKVTPPLPPINVETMRANLHATFNGGWEDAETRRAFHHGMDTVCNVLAQEQHRGILWGDMPGETRVIDPGVPAFKTTPVPGAAFADGTLCICEGCSGLTPSLQYTADDVGLCPSCYACCPVVGQPAAGETPVPRADYEGILRNILTTKDAVEWARLLEDARVMLGLKPPVESGR